MNNTYSNDIKEIKESINSIKESIKTLEKHVLDDSIEEDVRMRLKIAEDELSQLGYIYDTNIGLYGLYCNVESMYEVEDWNNNQIPPLSKCVPDCYK